MVKEKRILIYVLGWLILGYIICFIGINNVFAEEIQPIEIKSQIRTVYTDGSTQWYTSGINTYSTPLYFGTGPSYSTYGIPCNFRLLVIDNINNSYSYKYSYDMHIFTPYSTNNTWDSSKIDSLYDIYVSDDLGVIKDSKCTVVSTSKNSNALGTFINKKLSCVFTVNKSQNNTYISAGYFCKGNCNLTNMEPLGFIPQDSYMTLDNVKIERFNDNSNIIIDQNQTIIDQNNTTNEKLDDVQQSIIDSNKETQDVIKDQFNDCRDSYNLFNPNNVVDGYTNDNTGVIGGNGKSTGYIEIKSNNNYYILSNKTSGNWGAWYDENKKFISGFSLGSNIDEIIKSPSNAKYISFTVSFTNNNPDYANNVMIAESLVKINYEPYGEKICSNRLDETNDKLDNLQGTLTDSSAPNTSGLQNSAGWLPAGPLDSVLNLPLSLFNALTTNLNKSCNPINIPLPYVNKNITLPCINTLYNQIGITSFLSWIGVIVSGLMLYTYLLKLYKWIEDRISLNETHNVDSWGGL